MVPHCSRGTACRKSAWNPLRFRVLEAAVGRVPSVRFPPRRDVAGPDDFELTALLLAPAGSVLLAPPDSVLHVAVMRSLLGAVLSAVLFASSAHAADGLVPTGAWTVDFGDSRCVAYRAYGSQARPIHLILKPSAVGDVLQLKIVENGSAAYGIQEKVSLTLGDSAPVELWQLRYGTNGKTFRELNLSKAQSETLAGTSSLSWSGPGKDQKFQLGSMANLMKVIEECRTSLADYWNGTPTKQAQLKKGAGPARSILSLLSSDDYPSDAVRKQQSGATRVVALIDEKGQIADCSIIETSGIALLDVQTCLVMRRGKFTPAIDADGKPARGIFEQRIRWQMP